VDTVGLALEGALPQDVSALSINRMIRWCQANARVRAGPRWEVHGDWNDDPGLLRTEVCYLLGTQAQQEGLHIERRR
jgi:hypothetical protein